MPDDVVENNMLLQQKSAQMGNSLAEQQVNNNNKAKQNDKHKNKTCDFDNVEHCELNTEINLIYH